MTARRFELVRHQDVSGVSGTGVVAEGVEFTDRSVALHWLGFHPSTAVWPDLHSVLAVHGHDGATEVSWLDTGAGYEECGARSPRGYPYPCQRREGHDGDHGHAGVFWPNEPKPTPDDVDPLAIFDREDR